MVFDKKYWSEDEFTRKNGEPYVGYVGIRKGMGYIYETEEVLLKKDSWKAQIDTSGYFFDRILDEEIELPYTKEDIQFAANDFLTSTTLRNIILKLQTNNDYIFRNAIISNTQLPVCEMCNVLATYNTPYYVFIGKTGQEYERVTEGNKQDILDGYVNSNWDDLSNMNSYPLTVGEEGKPSYGDYYKVPHTELRHKQANGYLHHYDLSDQANTRTALDPTFYPQVNSDGSITEPRFNLHNLVHCDMTIVKVEGVKDYDQVRKLHLMVFMVFTDKVLIFKTIYYQGLETVDCEELSSFVIPDINFNEGSTDILVLTTIDPANKNSVKFLDLKDIELQGNYMYLVDRKLNAVLRYDISYLLHDESEISFTLKSIRLLDNISGDGTVNDPIYFNTPVAIAVADNWVYIVDQGNNCVKKYTSSFDYVTTLRNGKYATHRIESIAVNPYSPVLEDGTQLEPDSVWIFSTSGQSLYITVLSDDQVVYYQQIDKIQLLEDPYSWREEFNSVKFSFTNSNYYYISTTKRVYKLHLSRPSYPFALLTYFTQRLKLTSMAWNSLPYQWHKIPPEITWSYRPEKESIEVLDNRGFCVCGIASTAYTKENPDVQEQFEGDLVLHIGNYYNQSKLDTYLKENDCTFDQIPTQELAKMINCSGIFLYVEPDSFIYSVSNPNVPCYITEDLQQIKPEEYVNPITFNGHIYKVVYNLINLKNILIGRYQGAYNSDNIMVFDQLMLDDYFQQLKIDNNYDFYVYDNEPMSIVVNRVFENIWNIQFTILEHMKSKFISAPTTANGSQYRII